MVRECSALIDPSSEYCVLPKVDAYAMGYPEAANDDPVSPANNTMMYTSFEGYGQSALIRVAEVSLGEMKFRDVEFLAFDLPQNARFDVVLGMSLLKSTRLAIDYPNGRLRIERAAGGTGP